MIEWIVSSSVLIGAVLLLRLIFRDKISKRFQYALWALVLLRLMIPGSIAESAASIGNLLSSVTEKPVMQAASGALTPEISYDLAVQEVLDSNDYPSEIFSVLPEERQEAIVQAYQPQIQQKLDSYEKAYDTAQILKTVWLVGCALMAAFLLSTNLHFYFKLKRTRRKMDAGTPLPVYQSSAVQTPCLFGLIRPSIYLPDTAIDEKAMAYILAHEQTHYRHLDHIWSALRCICLALHWYNPLVWIAIRVSRVDSELACDEGTLAKLGDDSRESYGRTLIEMSSAKPSLDDYLLTATTMTGDKRSLYQRIQNIAKKPKFLLAAVIALAVISLVIVGCTFTGSKNNSNISADPSDHSTIPTYPSLSDSNTPDPPVLGKTDPIPWTVPEAPDELTYEEYFATEHFNREPLRQLSKMIITPNGIYTPHVKDGKLIIRHSYQNEEKDIFRVGTESYNNLLILSTDDAWFYCIEDGREFFRINPYGEKETLFVDETGKLPKAGESNINSRICFFESNRLIVFVAGYEDGYGVYRLYLPTKTVDIMGTATECPLLEVPVSNHRIQWSVGNEQFSSPPPTFPPTTPQETIPGTVQPDYEDIMSVPMIRMMGMHYVLDTSEGSLVQQLPEGYVYLGLAYEQNDTLPRWDNFARLIPDRSEVYASLEETDYIYYDTGEGYQRLIRAALVENEVSSDDPDNTAPEDYILAFFNTLLRPDSQSPYCQAAGQNFSQPEAIDLYLFCYNGFPEWSHGVVPLTEEEKAFLAANGWGEEKPMSNAKRFPISAMDARLQKYLGIAFWDTWGVGLDRMENYRHENQCYYAWRSDTRGSWATISSVERENNTYHITYQLDDYTGNTYRMTLIKTEGLFLIYSNVIVQ